MKLKFDGYFLGAKLRHPFFFFLANPCRTWITSPQLGTAVTDNNAYVSNIYCLVQVK